MSYETLKCNANYEILDEPPFTIRTKKEHKVVNTYNVTGGYRGVFIDYKRYLLQKLVAQQFIPNPDNKPLVRFIDGNPSNLTLSNLAYATRSEIIKAQYKRGTRKQHKCKKEYTPIKTVAEPPRQGMITVGDLKSMSMDECPAMLRRIKKEIDEEQHEMDMFMDMLTKIENTESFNEFEGFI